MSEFKFIGKPIDRVDEKDKVTGAAKYVDDINFGPNLLYAEIVESPYAHAKILSIDTSEAERVPGVVKVVTGKDFPYKFGLYMKDRYIFAQDRVRFVGEQVAAVIARDPKTAKKAAKLVKVEYEPLPAVFDPFEAVKEGAPILHPELGKYPHVPWFYPHGGTNIAHWRKLRKGDVEKGFAEQISFLRIHTESQDTPTVVWNPTLQWVLLITMEDSQFGLPPSLPIHRDISLLKPLNHWDSVKRI